MWKCVVFTNYVNLALVKQAVRELFKKQIVKQFLQPLIDASLQDAIHGTTPTRLFDAIGNIIKGQIWSYVKAGPLKLLSYLNRSKHLTFFIFYLCKFVIIFRIAEEK